MENETFQNKYSYYEWTNLPNGNQAAIAKYREFKLVEYNNNPMIETLPPMLSKDDFCNLIARYPRYDPLEREDNAEERFHYLERLSTYFEPLPATLELQRNIFHLLRSGYLSRHPVTAENNRRRLENSVNVSASASSLTIIGESGLGKSTNLAKILDMYPQVIIHPEYNCTQIVWLMVQCSSRRSLEELCYDIFLAIDRLLGTNYFNQFSSTENSEDYLITQLAQLAKTYHIGAFVIDEMQNLTNDRELFDFLLQLNNQVGIPVIRVGTSELETILRENFTTARRATGGGIIYWKQLEQDQIWEFFVRRIWEYQWTKTVVSYSQQISNVLYEETQGMIDLVIKLYKMVQWKAIASGGEEMITVDLIRKAAREGL